MPAPLGLRDVVGFVREAREGPVAPQPLVVSGPLARELASALAAGGRPELVRVGDHEGAAALVRVLGGEPSPDDVLVLRRAARVGTPIVAVQVGAWDGLVPYVPATEVIRVPAGKAFPVGEIARAIVRVAERNGVGLAAGLPVLAEPARAARVRRAGAVAAAVAGLSRGGKAHLPVITLEQARMLGDLRRLGGTQRDLSDPAALALTAGPELGVPLAVGLAGRGLVRRVGRGGPLLRVGVAVAATLALGGLARRVF